MTTILLFIIFIWGTIWGSFANVLVERGQKKKSLLGRSKCDFCGYTLRWFDNIPLLSFLIIGGKCRKCHKKLSWQYSAVELGMGLMFVLMAWKAGILAVDPLIGLSSQTLIELIYYLAIGFILFTIFLWDWKYMIIPDYLVAVGLGLSIIFSLYNYFYSPCSLFNYQCYVSSNLLGGLLVSGFFYLMFAFSKGKWIGGGDVKLGFWLGYMVSWRNVYFFLLIAYVLGSLVALGLLWKRKKKMSSQIAFGPFLIVSAILIIIFEQDLWLKWAHLFYW